MYNTAFNFDIETNQYSVTVRDLERSPHWKRSDADSNLIYDSRDPAMKTFYIMCEGTEEECRKVATCLEAAYALKSVNKTTVKTTV